MKKIRQFFSLAAALLLAAACSLSACADPALYDETADALYGGQALQFGGEAPKLYPGDSIYGLEAVYLGQAKADAGEAESLKTDDSGTAYWKNTASAVYQVTDITPQTEAPQPQTEMVQQTDDAGNPLYDDAGNPVMIPQEVQADAPASSGKVFLLDPAGYTVEVIGGTSAGDSAKEVPSPSALDAAGADGSVSQVVPDAKYYPEGAPVTLNADPAPDGQQFAGWKVSVIGDDGSQQDTDVSSLNIPGLGYDALSSSQVSFSMAKTSRVIVFTAQYTAAAPQTEVPQTDAPQTEVPQTDALQTEVPQTDVPQTEVLQTDAPQTDVPQADTGETTPEADNNNADPGVIIVNDDPASQTNIFVNFVGSDLLDNTIAAVYSDGLIMPITTAAENSAGQTFDHWDAGDSQTVVFEDAAAKDTTISFTQKPDADVTITAVYAETPQTDVPQTDVPQTDVPQTDVPQTDVPQTDTPQTDVPQTDVPQTDVPQTEIPQTEKPQTETPALYQIVYDPALVTIQGVDDPAAVPEGTLVQAAAALQNGMYFSGWDVEGLDAAGAGIDLTVNPISFRMPGRNVTLTPLYEQAVHAITYGPGSGKADQYTKISIIDENGNPLDRSNVAEGTQVYVRLYNTSADESLTGAKADDPSVPVPVSSLGDRTFTFTMPAYDVYLTYSADEASTYLAHVTVKGGVIDLGGGQTTADGAYLSGTELNVVAKDAPEGTVFNGWTLSDGAKAVLDDASAQTTVLTIDGTLRASCDVVLTANFKDVTCTLKVDSGSGSGKHTIGTPVQIKADPAKAGYRFTGWTLVSGKGTFGNQKAESTTFTMNSDAEVRAEYEPIVYTITVKNGKTSGTYTTGQLISLQADFPQAGKEFDKWSVTSGKIAIDSKTSYFTKATVQASDATIVALYKNGPSASDNMITGIQNDMEYLKSSTLTFSAVGAGMDNGSPNPGDYRYRPSGYQIGSVTGSWSKTPYTTSMAINQIGDYTLTVNFAREVYDGSTWNPDGTVDQKSVVMHIVNTLSVKTGDNSPILTLTLAAAAALAVIVVLIVIKARRGRR